MKDVVNKVHDISVPTPTSFPFPTQQWHEEDSINLIDL
jgi:hypothetical protein